MLNWQKHRFLQCATMAEYDSVGGDVHQMFVFKTND